MEWYYPSVPSAVGMGESDDEESGGGAREEPRRVDVTTEEGFQTALRVLLTAAESNGIDVHGSWLVDDAGDDGWGVEITELSRRSTVHAPGGKVTVADITEAVTAREGVEVTDLPPLHDAINPEVIERLRGAEETEGKRYVTFQYGGYWITVCSDGSVVVDE